MSEQADELARDAHRAAVWGSSVELTPGVALQIAERLRQRDQLLAYASHRRTCISTLPCSCGLDDLLARTTT